jgi:acetyltransferase-like isoleucine patch superfamily enzyme
MKRTLAIIQGLLWSIPEWLISNLPGPLGRKTRYAYWKIRMAHVGPRVTFGIGVRVGNPEFVSIGANTWIDDYVILLAGPPGGGRQFVARKPNPNFVGSEGELRIGRRCHIAQSVVLQAHGGLTIGDSSGVASGAKLYTLSHHYRDLTGRGDPAVIYKFSPCAPEEEQALIASPVVLEDSTAIGLNAVVLPGSTIRQGSWVGALSLVVGEIPAFTVASGNPAKVLKEIRPSR